jgi:glycosyltransferase involved in cell wall biosynthesis
MKTSVVIIAHNEEEHITECISSVLSQTQKADEVVLIVHNSTDKTLEIATRYPITIIPFEGNQGIVYARLKGLASVTGDIILCIDGDSFARKNWIAVMTKVLGKGNNILVGSWVEFNGTFFGSIANLTNRFFCVSKGRNATAWVWGPSFAFLGTYKKQVQEILERSIVLSKELKLSRNPDDYWLALMMSRLGNIEVTNKTHVTQYTKEQSSTSAITRNRENKRNGKVIRMFMKRYH